MISIIIPTYNRAKFLQEAINSVLEQSYSEFELIVVDDGSEDETGEICQNLDTRVKYICQDHQGVSIARNLGLRYAQGEFIALLDSDDIWTCHKLREQVEWMNAHSAIQLCHTNEIWMRNGRRVNQKKYHEKSGGWIYPACLPRCIICPSSVLIRRELFSQVGTFDELLPICEDYDLWLRITSKFEIGFIDKPLTIKRGGHADQLSCSEWGLDRYRVTAMLKILKANTLNKEWRLLTLNMLREKCQILSDGYRKRGTIDEAQHYEKIIQGFCEKKHC